MTEALARFDAILRFAVVRGISDVHLKPGQRPSYRRQGGLMSRKDETLCLDSDLDELARALVPARLQDAFAREGQATFVHGLVGAGRFRITALRQRGQCGLHARTLPQRVATLRELNLPKPLSNWALQPGGGLVIVAGSAGSGRTATWAALVEHVNTSASAPQHLITLEDPSEVSFDDKLALVRQREVGVDVPDAAAGIDAALRVDADAVALDPLPPSLLGKALHAAEQGRLVIAVLPGADAVDALQSAVFALPQGVREAARSSLARRLRGAVSHALVATVDGKGRVPAADVVCGGPHVAEVVRTGADFEPLRAIQERNRSHGMQTLDHALLDLVHAGQITVEAAVAAARNPDGLRDRLASSRGPAPKDMGIF
jgi:twitching motility protein PilT